MSQEADHYGGQRGGHGVNSAHRLAVIAEERTKRAKLAKVAKPGDVVGRIKPMGTQVVPMVQLDLFGDRVK